jgi:hypothetical protein
MNRISGRIVLKESGAGIPDLIVAVHDLEDRTEPASLRAALRSADRDGALAAAGRRVGSVVTDGSGAFELTYEDDPPRDGAPAIRRPGLFLVVLPPDESSDGQPPVLHASAAVRHRAGRVEQFLVRLSADQLRSAGLSVPAGTTAPELEQPDSVIHDVSEALKRQASLGQEMRQLASEQIAQARTQAFQVETALQDRLVEHLTGIPESLRERLGVVRPNATRKEIEAATWRTVARDVERVVNPQPPLVGYIQVPDSDLSDFQTAAGDFRDDLSPDEVEPYLFGDATASGRTVERIREDPVALARRGEARGQTLDEALAKDGNGPGEPPADHEEPPDAPVSSGDLPVFLGRLVRDVHSPEAALLDRPDRRPTREDVQKETDAFALRGGPADVPAVYDFHNLQIAFAHVWQHAIDDDVLERGEELVHGLIDTGADPIGRLQAGGDPLRALRAEVRNVQRAQTPAKVSPLLARGREDVDTSDQEPEPGSGDPQSDTAGIVEFGVAIQGLFRQPHQVLEELETLLREPYKFEIFAAGSVNFGLDVAYRQRWDPITYQVGNLVKTITLTPKESRKVSVKRTLKKDRMVREMENNLSVRKSDTSDTARDEAEIVRKALGKTTFSLTAQGSYDVGIADGDSTTSFTKDASTDSADVKKAFREAVIKAAQEFKDERKLEVETRDVMEEEVTESTEISNPNDELTVTYLFYELQRRFRVSEHLHRLTPVVLVAMEVPNPSRKAIDRLLLTHSWIISRVLLDDRYRPALKYLTTCIVGDELALAELRRTVAQLRVTVDRIQQNHTQLVNQVRTRNAALDAMMTARANTVASEGGEGFIEKSWEGLVGGGDEEDLEAARIREENARETYEKAVRDEKELRESLQSETAALNAATQAYAKAYAAHANQLLQIAGLRVHIKANILYYMQAIWSHTFRDQTFFSLHKLKVPVLEPRQKTYAVQLPAATPAHVTPRPSTTILEVRSSVTLEPPGDPEQDFVTLAEVADLDRPLGFKGNYMIFPMKRSNALTDFMMVPYVDAELGLHDPDELGSWAPEDFVEYVRSLKRTLTEAEFEAIEAQLSEQYRRIVSAPRRANEEIVVPTSSLYIETLCGAHPNLEDFKLKHRAMDVLKVTEEVRRLKLESLRYAARILEGEREDPDVERKVVITGNGQPIVVPPVEN